MAEWQLYIDESGDFDAVEDRVVVVGVLLAGADHPSRQQELRDWLKSTFPSSPYPPHQRILNLAAGVAACVAREPARVPELQPAVDALDACPLRDDVRELRTTPVATFRDAKLRTVDNWMRSHARGAYDLLKRHITQRRGVASRGFAKVIGEGGAVVAAAEARPRASSQDRYLDLLTVLIERVVLLLADGNSHRVVTVVGARDVTVPGRTAPGRLAPLVRCRLQREHVEQAAKTACSRLPQSSVSFAIAQPATYDSRCHPGLVLADLAANRVHGAIYQETFRDLSESLVGALGAPPLGRALAVSADLPSLAGSGRAADAIADVARNPSRNASTAGVIPRWAREQADAWIAALGTADR